MQNNKQAKIWITSDKNDLYEASIVIKDENQFERLLEELENTQKLMFIKYGTVDEKKDEYYNYSAGRENEGFYFNEQLAARYIKRTRKYEGEYIDYASVHYFYNPLGVVRSLLMGDLKSGDLLELFTRTYEESKNSQLKSYINAKKLIDVLSKTTEIDKDILKKTIESMWPNFAFFAFNVIQCIDIKIDRVWKINELSNTLKQLENINVETQKINEIISKSKKEIEEILSKNEVAQRNSEILKLAQKTNLYFGQEKNNDREKESESNLSLILKNKQ